MDYFFEKTKQNKEKAEKAQNLSKSEHPNVKSSNCDNEQSKSFMGFDIFREAIRLYDLTE